MEVGGVSRPFVHRGISRGKQFDVEDAEDEIRANREMAEVTSLIVNPDSLSFHSFTPPNNQNSVSLTKTKGASGTDVGSTTEYRLTSIQAQKPN